MYPNCFTNRSSINWIAICWFNQQIMLLDQRVNSAVVFRYRLGRDKCKDSQMEAVIRSSFIIYSEYKVQQIKKQLSYRSVFFLPHFNNSHLEYCLQCWAPLKQLRDWMESLLHMEKLKKLGLSLRERERLEGGWWGRFHQWILLLSFIYKDRARLSAVVSTEGQEAIDRNWNAGGSI